MKIVYPKVTHAELAEAFEKLQIEITKKPGRVQLEEVIAKLEEPPAVATTKNDMALSINDLPSSAEINSYILLVLYDYSLQKGCLSVIEPHVQQIISKVQNVLPFG